MQIFILKHLYNFLPTQLFRCGVNYFGKIVVGGFGRKRNFSAARNLLYIICLTEAQVIALERKKEKQEAHGEIETEPPGYLDSQDTYYVGAIRLTVFIHRPLLILTAGLPLQNSIQANTLSPPLIFSTTEYFLFLTSRKYHCYVC